jgi:hypothetical protein
MILLASELNQSNRIESAAGATKTKGQAEVIGTLYGFWFGDVANGEKGTFVIGGNLYEADCDNTIAYTAGDALYDDGTTPTGVLNKTAGAGRVVVGYVTKDYGIGTAKILLVPRSQ